MSVRITVLLLCTALILTSAPGVVATASPAGLPASDKSQAPLLAVAIPPTASAASPHSVVHVAVEVWEDKDGDRWLDPDLDGPYMASDFQLLLQVDDGSGTHERTMTDSDDGLINGRTKTDIEGDFYAVQVAWAPGKLIVAPNYQDISNVCPGPPLSPNGCVHSALLYNGTTATLRLLVAPKPVRKTYMPFVVRSLPPAQATLRIEVYEDGDNSGTITGSDPFYTASVLQIGFNENQLIVKDVRGVSSVQVPAGEKYEFSGLTGLAPAYRDVSAQCSTVPPNLGGCPLTVIPPSGGQATIKLLVQQAPDQSIRSQKWARHACVV
jgi:hypothetical protein